MVRGTLTDKEWDSLDEVRFSTKDAVVFRNATIVLMTAVGRSKDAIAQDLGCSRGTVDLARKRYREDGVAGLSRHKPPGRPSRATSRYRAAVRKALETAPQDLGYGFSVWSAARLNEHLKRTVGICFSTDRLRSIMHEEGFSFQRPKHTMKGKRDEVAFEKARRQLKRLKKGRCRMTATLS